MCFFFLTLEPNCSQFFSWKLSLYVSISRFLWPLFIFIFNIWAIILCVRHCVWPTTHIRQHRLHRITKSISIVWLRPKLLLFIIQCEAIFMYYSFVASISQHTNTSIQQQHLKRRRYFPFDTNAYTLYTHTQTQIRFDDYIHPSDNVISALHRKCRVVRLEWNPGLYLRLDSYSVAYNRQDRFIMPFAIK